MTLGFYTRNALTLSDDIVKDGIVKLIMTGTTYGGRWIMLVRSLDNAPDAELYYGEMETDPAKNEPDLAVEAAEAWLRQESEKLGFEVVAFYNCNDEQRRSDPASADFFSAATATLVRKG